MAQRRISPNAISLLSIVFAATAGAALYVWTRFEGWPAAALLVIAAIGIQLRLICNLIDGMVAVEGGMRSAVGDLYNEVPDRVADSLVLLGIGYGLAHAIGAAAIDAPSASDLLRPIELAWCAALLAMFTAYIRVLGQALGVPGCFHGPMAKQHRMALITVASVGTAAACVIAPQWTERTWILWGALALIAVGSAFTCIRRLRAIALALRTRA